MAIKNEYVLNFKSQGVTKTKQEVDKLDDSTDKLSKTTDSKLSPALKKAKIAIAALGTATIAAATHAIKTAAQFEALRTRLNTMYGSVNAGTKAFNTFNKIAATTPFALQNVVEAGASLKAFGLDAEENIKGLSDLAAFMGLDIVEAASAMGRAFAGGAGAADVLRERGVLELIKSFKGIDDITKLSLPEFRQALKEAIEDPSLGIAGATDALADTFQGRLSNMKDAVDRLADSYGQRLLPIAEHIVGFLGGVANAASGATNAFDEQILAVEKGQGRLKILTENLLKTEKGSNQWKMQLREIKREYPDFLKGLEDEDINLQSINGRLDTYNKRSAERIENLEKEKKREALLEKQRLLISKQAEEAQNYADNLTSVDDILANVFDKAKDKTDMSTEAGLNFLSNLDSIRKELTAQEDLYLQGKISTEEFYGRALQATSAFRKELGTAADEGVYFNDILKSFGGVWATGPVLAIQDYIGELTTLTDNLTNSNIENERSIKNTSAQYDALGNLITDIDNELAEDAPFDVKKLLLDPIAIKESGDATEGYLDSITAVDAGLQVLPESTANSLKGAAKFSAGMKAITKDLFAQDSAIRDQVIGSMGAIAMASAGSKAEQLKVQKMMVKANVAKGIIDIFTDPTPTTAVDIAKAVALSASLVARGVTQTKTIDEQIANINATKGSIGQTSTRFAQYGMNEVVDQATPIIAGEAGAELVQITPLEGANVDGPQGSGNIVITGNVLSRDFVQSELIDELREAIRQGYDFR